MQLIGKKILVTGSDGFIGSHLVEALMDEGAKVKAFCYYNSFNSLGWLDTFDEDKLSKIEIFTGDIRDPYGVKNAIKGVDIIFHLAALIGIPYSYSAPDNYIDTNIKGTLNILQAAREAKVNAYVFPQPQKFTGQPNTCRLMKSIRFKDNHLIVPVKSERIK